MKKGISFFPKNLKGQIWIETVIYTLIALVMIGLVLAFARPKIQELQDMAIIDQSITMMKEIDSTILNIGGEGSIRIIEVGIKKGGLTIDSSEDRLFFEMESNLEYSDPNVPISEGNLILYTEKRGSATFVNMTRDYSDSYDIRFEDLENAKVLTKSSTFYKLSLKYSDYEETTDKIVIDMELI